MDNVTVFRDIDLSKVKLSLKIELSDNDLVKIKIVFVKPDCLNKSNYGIFRDYELDYTVWTSSSFLFDARQLRLPDNRNINLSLKSSCKFSSETHRKESLKKLYTTLHKWSNNISEYKDKGEVILDDEYWYVL